MSSPLETLKALVSLQEIDLRIHEQEKGKESIPSRLEEIDELLGAKRSVVADERNQLAEAEMARRVAESDLKAEKEKLKKWEARLGDIKSNRDYQALSREIEMQRKANLGLEDEILRKMQEIEDLKESIGGREQELAEEEGDLTSERNELEGRLAEINAHIAGEEDGRKAAESKVEGRWLKMYRQIRDHRDGLAVVEVRNESCMGCHMGIPPQLYNIVLRGEQIEKCPFCHRIFFYKEALDPESGESGESGDS